MLPQLADEHNAEGSPRLGRPFYEQEQLNTELNYTKPTAQNKFHRRGVSGRGVCHFLASMFPVVGWLSRYKFRRDIVGDLVSGCTVAVMHIPQGMGYAMLANVPPIVGLYTAFIPVLVYFVFGTSRHNSMGTFAVVSLMVGKSVLTYAVQPGALTTADDGPQQNATASADMAGWADVTADLAVTYTATEVAATLCFLVGLMQLSMYVLRLGIISTLLSETLVSGFTTGAAIYVLTSQVKDLLGIRMAPQSGYFQLINTYIAVFHHLYQLQFNWAAIVVSAITILIMVLNNDHLKPALAKRCAIPMPIELIAVVGGTLAAQLLDLTAVYDVRPIGHIPTGMPAVRWPRFELLGSLVLDGAMVTMVSYTATVSMALLFAQRQHYEIDFNQELLAMGNANVVGSCFGCLPLAASLSRSLIQHGVGGRTQIASVVSCSILAVVLLWIGPFFEALPRCVLASVIVVSLKGMLLQCKQVAVFWRLSRLDAFVWVATFATTITVAIDIGLVVGIALSLASIFIRGMRPHTCLLGNVPHTDLYLDVGRYKAAVELPYVKIFHYRGSLNFASRGAFKTELCRRIELDLPAETRRAAKAKGPDQQQQRRDRMHIKCLVIDFSALSYIDPSACTALKSLVADLNQIGIAVLLAGSSCPTYELMKKCDLRESADGAVKFYPTVHDAVHQAIELVAPSSPISVIIGTA